MFTALAAVAQILKYVVIGPITGSKHRIVFVIYVLYRLFFFLHALHDTFVIHISG